MTLPTLRLWSTSLLGSFTHENALHRVACVAKLNRAKWLGLCELLAIKGFARYSLTTRITQRWQVRILAPLGLNGTIDLETVGGVSTIIGNLLATGVGWFIWEMSD